MTDQEFWDGITELLDAGRLEVFQIEGAALEYAEWRAMLGFRVPQGHARLLDAHHIPRQGFRFVRWAADPAEVAQQERVAARGNLAFPVKLQKPLRRRVLEIVHAAVKRQAQNARAN